MGTVQALETRRSVRDARIARYGRVDLGRVQVRRAKGAGDLAVVEALRRAGFARIASVPTMDTAWIDESDYSPGTFSLIAYNGEAQPVATMRVQDGRVAPLELQSRVPLDVLIEPGDHPAAQFGRLTAIKAADATEAMFGLFKAAWRWCLVEGLQSIVIATPPWSKPIYDFMLFDPLGPDAEFRHEFAGGAQHVVMKLPVQSAEQAWRSGRHPLCAEFFDIAHPSLEI